MPASTHLVGTVALLEGRVIARGVDGVERVLTLGAPVFEGDLILTGAGGRIELAFEQAKTYLLGADETLTLDASVFAASTLDAASNALLPTPTNDINQAIVTGQTLDQLLEETAAGLNAGAAGNDGHSFVRLLRIAETLTPQGFEFNAPNRNIVFEPEGRDRRLDALADNTLPPADNDPLPVAPPTPETPIAPINLAPETANLNASGTSTGATNPVIAIRLTGSDADGSIVSFTVIDLPANGTLFNNGVAVTAGSVIAATANGADLIFVPNTGFNGDATFRYVATDNGGATDATPATATIQITHINALPDSVDFSVNGTTVGASNPPIVIQLAGSDVDGTVTGFTILNLPPNGILYNGSTPVNAGDVIAANANGATLTFVPATAFGGISTFQYAAVDNSGGSDPTPATVSINVGHTNTAPESDDLNVSGTTSGAANPSVNVHLSGSDQDGRVVEFIVNDLPANGTLLNNGVAVNVGDRITASSNGADLTFVPNTGFAGNSNFHYSAVDNNGAIDATPATVNLAITHINAAPVIAGDAVVSVNEAVNTGVPTPYVFQVSDFSSTYTDVDGGAAYSVVINALPAAGNGTLALNGVALTVGASVSFADIAAGKLSYTPPDANYSGADVYGGAAVGNQQADAATFSYRISDGIDSSVASATAHLNIVPVADTPSFGLTPSSVLTVRSVNFETGVSGNYSLAPLLVDGAVGTDNVWWSNNISNQAQATAVEAGFGVATYGITAGPGAPIAGNVLELARDIGDPYNDFHTTLPTVAGAQYTIEFDYAARSGYAAGTASQVNVSVNGVTVAAINTNSTTASHHAVTFTGSGNNDLIEFYVPQNLVVTSSHGGLLDNIVVNQIGIDSVLPTVAAFAGEAFALPVAAITAALADNDGSEQLHILVSGLPIGSVIYNYDAATNHFVNAVTATSTDPVDITGADFSQLKVVVPGGVSGDFQLQFFSAAFEIANGTLVSQQPSTTLANLQVHVAPVLGLHEGDASLATPQQLFGGRGADTLTGGSGSDTLVAAQGGDTLHGGKGSDVLGGGIGADTFEWGLGDGVTVGARPIDTVWNFDQATRAAGGDRIDLRDLLVGELHAGNAVGNLDKFLHFDGSSGDTVIHVSSTGQFAAGQAPGAAFNAAAENQTIVLHGLDLTFGFSSDAAVIQDLLSKGKLVVD